MDNNVKAMCGRMRLAFEHTIYPKRYAIYQVSDDEWREIRHWPHERSGSHMQQWSLFAEGESV